ncbi:hypothetical protein [Candidatus Epulonipiscium viviparus]|uniref:hypothetical protein n=1 Tax=Candidatus Epulonipiscium viviparus TaxID=420336 RepID=UPI0027380441|nr:hypothetical protein [Candidatus Epulopiscium viviparus]
MNKIKNMSVWQKLILSNVIITGMSLAIIWSLIWGLQMSRQKFENFIDNSYQLESDIKNHATDILSIAKDIRDLQINPDLIEKFQIFQKRLQN